MNDFKIHILEELDPESTSIIDDYWSIENGKFLNAPKLIASKNNLKINDLNKLIKANSVCKINHGECEDCGIELIKEITSQSAFKTNIYRKEDRCKNCSDIY